MNDFMRLGGNQPAKTSLRAVRSVSSAALQNEQVTRKRVDALEQWAGAVANTVSPLIDLRDYLDSGIWARARWLVLGSKALPVKREAPVEDAARPVD